MSENQFAPPLLKMIDLNAADVFSGMILAFAITSLLSLVIRKSSLRPSHEPGLSRTMILLATIVSLIMAVIGNSLARAFGAIGALSLVRFRTAVKSSNELAYLFMSIAVGMACGSGYFAIATGAAGLFMIFAVLVEKFFSDDVQNRLSLLKIIVPEHENLPIQVLEKVKSLTCSYRLLSQEKICEGQSEMLVEISLADETMAGKLIKNLSDLNDKISVQVVLDQT